MLTAALDAARLGAPAPLTAGFLRAAAPGYCTSTQQARAPRDWLERALAYATARRDRRAGPSRDRRHGPGRRVHRCGLPPPAHRPLPPGRPRPASTWDAALDHVRDPDDATRLADSAQGRLLYRYAIPLYRHAADAGDKRAARKLADLLADRGDLKGLRACADARDPGAALSWPAC